MNMVYMYMQCINECIQLLNASILISSTPCDCLHFSNECKLYFGTNYHMYNFCIFALPFPNRTFHTMVVLK